jgi:hypothetical protein
MRGRETLILGAILVLLSIVSCIPRSSSTAPVTSTLGHGAVVRLHEVPIPEGPTAPSFERGAEAGDTSLRPLERVTQYVPTPLPLPLEQPANCEFGGNLVVTFVDGFELIYGPCTRPGSIDRLWAAMEFVIEHGQCAPGCGPNGVNAPQAEQP